MGGWCYLIQRANASKKKEINVRAMRSDGSLHVIRSFYPQSARLLPLSLFPLISHPAQDPPGEVSRPKKEDEDRIGAAASRTRRLKCRSLPAPADAPVCATFGASSGWGWVPLPPRFPRISPSRFPAVLHPWVMMIRFIISMCCQIRPCWSLPRSAARPSFATQKKGVGGRHCHWLGNAGVVPATVSKQVVQIFRLLLPAFPSQKHINSWVVSPPSSPPAFHSR